MHAKMDIGTEQRTVSRVVTVGHSLYCVLPTKIIRAMGLKKGDRLALESDGRMLYAVKIPMEELLHHKTKPNGGNATIQARPDGYQRGEK